MSAEGRPTRSVSAEGRPTRSVSAERSAPRIALFTHDTFGLGHVRRCLHISRALAAARPEASILLVTGSPALHVLQGLPPNMDVLKIPTVARTGAKKNRPPHLPLPLAETLSLRARVVREALLAFGPDVLLVDNFPLGAREELLPALQEVARSPTRAVLGLRDVLGAPETVRGDWRRQGMYRVLERYYDRILVYGVRDVLDVEEAYDLPPSVGAKVRYCGYVTAPPGEAAAAELGLSGPFLLATGGGGGDAYPLLQTLLEALPLLPDLPVAVVTGPLMSAAQREKLRRRAAGHPGVVVRDYAPELGRHIRAAAVVVSMCGYNTATEIVAAGTPAVVIPRTWKYGEHLRRGRAGTEAEQMMRAQALARLGLVHLLEPERLTPERLAERITAALEEARSPSAPATAATNGRRPALDLDGLRAVTSHLLELAEVPDAAPAAGGADVP